MEGHQKWCPFFCVYTFTFTSFPAMHIFRLMKTQQEIFDEIKSSDNKQLWTLASTYSTLYKKIDKYREREKDREKKIGGVDIQDIVDNKSLLRTHVIEHLFEQSKDKHNAQASKALIDVCSLKEEEQDIHIQIKSYCGSCGCEIKSGE